ncbi:hypothetical protein AZA_57133 [Nitrospirillum viridazoti Y2]|nr:hypothetical protein AZA_57133 [Nitrospirillum amazonense Y2]
MVPSISGRPHRAVAHAGGRMAKGAGARIDAPQARHASHPASHPVVGMPRQDLLGAVELFG